LLAACRRRRSCRSPARLARDRCWSRCRSRCWSRCRSRC